MDLRFLTRTRHLLVLLVVLGMLSGKALAEDTAAPPFRYVWGKAYHVLPETHGGSGYFSLCEGLNGKIYVGTTKYGVNSYLVEFDPKTEKQRIVIDTHSLCGLGVTSYNEAQSKIHTRNFVGPSGKIYVGSMNSPREDDPSKYPGGYVMTYDPNTGVAECLGMPSPGYGVIDVVADEGRGIIYVVLIGAEMPWMLYDVRTKHYRELGPVLNVWTTTLIDRRGHANVLTKDFELAQYEPDTGKVVVRDIVVDGKKLSNPAHPLEWVPFWKLAQDGRTAYLIHMQDATLYEIDLLSEGGVVKGVSHGKMIEGENVDMRSGLNIDSQGRVYAAVRTDMFHLVRFDPQREKMEEVGVLAVENPDFFGGSPYRGYHTLPDGTLTPSNCLAMTMTRDGTIYATVLHPFTLLKIEGVVYSGE